MRLSLPVGRSSRSRTMAEVRTTLQMLQLHDVPPGELSSFPLRDIDITFALCLQQDEVAAISMKTQKSHNDFNLKDIAETYGPLLQRDFSVDVAAAGRAVLEVTSFGLSAPRHDSLAEGHRRSCQEAPARRH